MAPNPAEMPNVLENPVRDAAIHFGAFLQVNRLLQGGDQTYGNIGVIQLLDQFSNHYQPRYRSYLVVPELLPTLRRYRVILRSPRRSSGQQNNQRENVVRIVKHPNPSEVRQPDSMPRQRLYVDQTRVMRGKFVRSDVVNEAHCRLCKVSFFNDDSKQQHINSDLHKFRLLYREKRSSFKSAVGNNSISVAELPDSSDVILRSGQRRDITVKVNLDTAYAAANFFKIIDLSDVDTSSLEFQDDAPIEVKVSAMFSEPGAYIYPLVVKVIPANLCLLKDLIFRVESELMDQLAPVSPYVHKQDVVREMEGSILPGEQLAKAPNSLLVKMKLVEHKLPHVYNKLLLHKLERYDNMSPHEEETLAKVLGLLCGLMSYRDALRQVSEFKAPFIMPLDCDNYSDRFALLVDLEELQQQRQVKNYDRPNEKLHQQGSRFLLRVPDLSEGRPSVTKGDKVHVRLQDDEKITYEGIIHQVQEEGLLLGFHREFMNEYTRLKQGGIEPRVDVRFTVNRFPILNMHRALTLMKKHQAYDIVFPKRQKKPANNPLKPRPWENTLIGGNPSQQQAIKKIMSKSSGSAPYLVFGPPGTGKTVTLVETIVQVWLTTQTSPVKQLICAPSNSACNNIAERLISALPAAKILRLFSLSSEMEGATESLLMHSNFSEGSFYMPTIDVILQNHIIIVTIVTSGRLVTGGASKVFQYVYVDECGQASEPECLIAIAGLLTAPPALSRRGKIKKNKSSESGQLVLAGDPQQLGPILSSQPAVDFGLGMSLLERLMNHNDLYKRPPGSQYDNNYLTKLVQNFRSHPAILEIPNRLFYDNELEVKGDPSIINKAVGWKGLPNKNFPLIFHNVQGVDERESNSPSYFNRQEIDRVIMYMKKLFQTGLPNNYKVKQEDIGIITPYRKQVSKFRKAFETLGWDIFVGSVEQFQGREKLIVFISTVRSNIALVEEDYRFKLGFLKNPKRFNVSITRAQALLIVVGNPRILRHDKHWHQLICYCRDNKAAVNLPQDFPNEPPNYSEDHIAG